MPAHYHASDDTLDAVLEDINIGPDHEHTKVEGGRPEAVPAHTHAMTTGTITGAATPATIEEHTHLKDGGGDSDTGRRTAAQDEAPPWVGTFTRHQPEVSRQPAFIPTLTP